MTPNRPPAASSAGAWASAWRSAPGSSLTAMRTAWNVRVATWRRRGHAARGTAARTAATRSPVRARGRRRTIARAMRRAWGSSPYSKMIRASSASGRWFRSVAAVCAAEGSRRMSRGSSSRWKEKPRPDSSSCQEETPRSSRIAPARQRVEQRGRPLGAVALVLLEPGAIPDLESRQPSAPQRHFLVEPRQLPHVRREEDAPRRVERHVLGARDVEPAHLAHLRVERGLLAQLRLNPLPLLERMHLEALAIGHDDQPALVMRQGVPKLRRHAQAPLRVERVLIAPPKHGRAVRLCASSHSVPLR